MRKEAERGQAIVLFALLLVVVVAAAGLLLDSGTAFANRRQAQSAADLAALAAARAVAENGFNCNATGSAQAQAAAASVAAFNGFTNVSVEYPATSGSKTGCTFVRVTVSRPMDTSFSKILGQNTWTPQASAVASLLRTQSAANARCTFCSLNSSDDNHTLLVQLGSTLIVDGDIYVNSSNGLKPDDPNSAVKLKDWFVGGDGFDIFGTGGRIEADRISVVGGWETHDDGIAIAHNADCPASQRPDPLAYAALGLTSNVCIHQPVLPDPLGNFPTPNGSDYPVMSTKKLSMAGSTAYTIQPGVYIGGISIAGNAVVTMAPGMYYMQGGDFVVSGNGSVVGVSVTIYAGAPEDAGKKKKKGEAGGVDIETKGSIILTPPTTGVFAGMTIYIDRESESSVVLQPNNVAQCATAGGCIGGISGTIYAAHQESVVIIKAAGSANLQVISGRLLVQNGATARFTFDSAGFAASSTLISLVE